jgi:hypothetical protein
MGCAVRRDRARTIARALRQEHRRSPAHGRQLHSDDVQVTEIRSWVPFQCSHRLRSQLEGFAPTIPDWANDQHTLAGREMGRGLDHLRTEGAKLVPPPTGDDPYDDEAYRLWRIKQQNK